MRFYLLFSTVETVALYHVSIKSYSKIPVHIAVSEWTLVILRTLLLLLCRICALKIV